MNGQKNAVKLDSDELIKAIARKLDSNRSVLQMSINFGRLKWRRSKKGDFEIDLELSV